MPGPVSDSYDPEFGTGFNADSVADGIQGVVDRIAELLGPQLLNIVAVAQGEPGKVFEVQLAERELRLIRFGLLRALETI